MPFSNREVSDVFSAVADSMEILGEDRFRTQAYRRAADVILELPAPLASYREHGELETIAGIGKAIADKVCELLDTGVLSFYERLKVRVPPGVLELLRVPSIGPRTAGRLYSELGVASLADLQQALEAGRLRTMKGFGAKTIEGIVQGVATAQQRDQRTLLGSALVAAEGLIAALRGSAPMLSEVSYAGSLRRARQTIGDIDILVSADDRAGVIAAFTALPLVARVESAGVEKATVVLQNGLQVDLLVVSPRLWGTALQHFTGSKAHNIRFRALAQDRGFRFSEHGFVGADGSVLTCASEAEVYATLGLPWVPPELREDMGEFEAAFAGWLPELVEVGDLQGDLHMHSTWSDGKASIREMAQRARSRGYRYIAITDHSAYLGITNGLDGARLRQQAAEIAQINGEFALDGFRILRGVEVDITPDGSLALPDEVLAELDVVVASPHVSLRQAPEAATERLLRAIRNPHVDIIGHPTGRLLQSRDGSDVDIEVIGRAAAEMGTLLEVNSGPERLDLEAGHVRRVLACGARVVVDSDSHHPDHLSWIRLGVLTARRGWATPADVANTWDVEQVLSWIARRGRG